MDIGDEDTADPMTRRSSGTHVRDPANFNFTKNERLLCIFYEISVRLLRTVLAIRVVSSGCDFEIIELPIASIDYVNQKNDLVAKIVCVVANLLERAGRVHEIRGLPDGPWVFRREHDEFMLCFFVFRIHQVSATSNIKDRFCIQFVECLKRVVQHCLSQSTQLVQLPATRKWSFLIRHSSDNMTDPRALITDTSQIGDGLDDGESES